MRFDVRALRADGSVTTVPIEATDLAAALQQARTDGLAVLSARASRGPGPRVPRHGRFPLQGFCQELVSLLKAGLTLPEILDAMTEKESRPEPRRVLEALRTRLREGQALSAAMDYQAQIFPPLLVATVRAAEQSGDLPEALGRYIDYQLRLDVVRKKIISASIYPLLLLGVGTLVTLFLMTYVVPRFAAIYAEAGRDLPWLARLLMEWGLLMNGHGAFVLSIAIACLGALAVTAKRIARLLSGAAARIPGLGERLLVFHLARFYRTLGMLTRGGMPIVPALSLVGGLLPSDLQSQLRQASRQVTEGSSLSQAMAQAGLTTPIALRMLRVGEKSGDMAQMMERIASFHDEELANWVDWFTRLFEPLLMALIGLVIGGIVVLMYLPIFELAGSLQ